MAKNSSFFDLLESIVNEMAESAEKINEVIGETSSKNVKTKAKTKKSKTKKVNKNYDEEHSQMGVSMEGESLEGISMMGTSMEGQTMMKNSVEGVSQMNYSMEGTDKKIHGEDKYHNFKDTKKSKALLKLNSKNELKKGLILTEILGKPMSLRD